MKKTALTKEHLFEVASAYFDKNNVAPTQSYLRSELGGSFSTIGPMLREWREQSASTTKSVLEMPDNVRDSALEMVGSWWLSIQSIVNEKVDAIQEKANNAVSVAQDEVSEYLEEVKRLEQTHDESVTAITALNSELEATTANNDQLTSSLESTISDKKIALKSIVDLELKLSMIENENAALKTQAAIDAVNVANAVEALQKSEVAAAKTLADTIAKSEKDMEKSISDLTLAHDKALRAIELANDKSTTALNDAASKAAKQFKATIAALSSDKRELLDELNITRDELKQAMKTKIKGTGNG